MKSNIDMNDKNKNPVQGYGDDHLETTALKGVNENLKSKETYYCIFENNPMPMWIIDLETFRFLDVNAMATIQYGYTYDEFLAMTAIDIRPEIDKESFINFNHSFNTSISNYNRGIWNHKKKDGSIIKVEIFAQDIFFKGNKAKVIIANDVTEKQKLADRLITTEKRFRTLTENGIEGNIILNQDGEATYISPTIEKLLGYSVAEIKRLDVFTLAHPNDRDSILETWHKMKLNPQMPIIGKPARFIHKDGTWHLVKYTLTNFLNDSEINGVVNNFWDITETKDAEDKLLLTQFAIDNAGDAVCWVDWEGRLINANQATINMLGYTKEELLKLSVSDFDCLYEREKYLLHFQELRQKKSIVLETIHRTKDGREIQVEIRSNYIQYGDKELNCAFGRDITERKKIEQQIKNNEKFFRALVETGADAVALLTAEGKPFYVSPTIEKVLGYTEAETLQLELFSLFHPDEITWAISVWEQVLKNPGLPIVVRPSRMMHKDGNWRWLEGTLTNLLDDPAVNGIVDNFRDVTQRKTTEEKQAKINRLYSFISSVNNMIVKIQDEQTLFDEVCKIAVDVGKFKMSWIGLIDEQTKKITPIAFIGEVEEYLSKIVTISTEDNPEGRGPAGTAVRENRYVFCNDVENDSRMLPWKKQAILCGYYSVISLPIKKNGKTIGVYTLYAATKHFFDSEEIDLLVEIADNINFALDNFEKEIKRKTVENDIAKSEARLLEAQSISHMGSWEMDFKNEKHYWSDELFKIYGTDKNETENVIELFLSCVHPDDYKYVLFRYQEDLRLCRNSYTYFRFIRKNDKALRYGYAERKFEFDENNKPCRLVGIVKDITEAKEAELQLKKSEEFSAGVLNSLNSCIAVIDKTGTVIKSNQAWNIMAAGSKKSMPNFIIKGENYFEILDKAAAAGNTLAEQTVSGIRDVMFGQKTIYHNQYNYQPNSTNEKWWFDMTVLGFLQQSDMVIINIQDVTDLKRIVKERDNTFEANQELEKTKYELKNALKKEMELNELKSRFVSMASHEFRTPLTTMNLSLSLITKYGEQDDKMGQAKHIDKIKKSIYNLTEILNDFLSVSKLEEGKVQTVFEQINLKLYFKNIITEMQSIASANQTLKYQHLGEEIVFIDTKLLQHILLNLISNALKFSLQNSVIEVYTEVLDDSIKISVKDYGIGINEEDQKHLFERFFRAQNAMHIPGTGLGLNIVARYVEQMNGTINFTSKENEGTIFTIVLPKQALLS